MRTKKEVKVTMSESTIKREFLAVYELTKSAANAIMEFTDNAIDADATDFIVKFVGNRMLIINNGKPFAPGRLYDFLNTYSVNDLMGDSELKRKLGNSKIGRFGCGATDALITLSDYIKGSTATIRSWSSPSEMEAGSLKVDERDIEAFLREHPIHKLSKDDPMVGFLCEGKSIGGVSGLEFKQGVCFEIENPRFSLIGRMEPFWLKDTILRTSMCYSRTDINLVLCDHKVEKYDPVFLNRLTDEELSKDGFYKKGNVFFCIKTYRLHYIDDTDNKDDRFIKAVYAFTLEYGDLIKGKGKKPVERNEATDYGGIYTSYQNRILTLGLDDKLLKTQRGGFGRLRVNIGAEGNEDLLLLKSTKSNGIDYSNASNQELSMYEVVNPLKKKSPKLAPYLTFEEELSNVKGTIGQFYSKAIKVVKSGGDVSITEFENYVTGKPTVIAAPKTQTKDEEARLIEMAEASAEADTQNNEFSVSLVTVKNAGDKLVYEFNEDGGYMINKEQATTLLDVLSGNKVRPNKMTKIVNEFLVKVSPKV